jgi:hypothetical protein
MLYEKHNYLNRDINYLMNTPIFEYDIQDAGFSIIKNKGLLDEGLIAEIGKMKKMEKNIFIGKLQREDKTIAEEMINEFVQIRKRFFEKNSIPDEKVLSIKKDAVFLINFHPSVKEFDGYKFVAKNKYTSYFYLNRTEFYYDSKREVLDVKGLGREVVKVHKDHFLSDLRGLISMREKLDDYNFLRVLRQYRERYLELELDVENYREMNRDSMFKLKNTIGGEQLLIEAVDDDVKDMLDIGYNYIHYIIPMIGNLV